MKKIVMNEERRDDYNHARKIAEAIVEGNEEVICDFIAEDERKAVLLAERLEDEERATFLLNKIKNSPKEQHISRLIREIEQLKMKRRRAVWIRGVASAAAAVLIAFFVFHSEEKESTSIVAQKIASAPVLITETGESINLDTVDDAIVTNSYTIKKDGENRLSYKLKEATVTTELEKIQYNELRVPSQYTYKLKLEDETNVTLNACSSLKYPTKFIGDRRFVELQGEGYFEVTKSDKPFLVKVNNMVVKVYGTQFNIKVLNNKNVETVLIEGSIGVTIDAEKEIVMSPNQLLVYDTEKRSTLLSTVEALNSIEWLSDNFNFVGRPFKSVVDDLSRWYGVDFKFYGDVTDLNLTLFARRNSSIDEITKFIERLTDVKFVKEGGQTYGVYR